MSLISVTEMPNTTINRMHETNTMIHRCSWANSSEILQKYHDEEWGDRCMMTARCLNC
jgi:predicted short-subunit dehydrogenase-like oxidoreductase (DUF2520 family)